MMEENRMYKVFRNCPISRIPLRFSREYAFLYRDPSREIFAVFDDAEFELVRSAR